MTRCFHQLVADSGCLQTTTFLPLNQSSHLTKAKKMFPAAVCTFEERNAFMHINYTTSGAQLYFYLFRSLASLPPPPPHLISATLRDPPPNTHTHTLHIHLSFTFGKLLNGHSRFPPSGAQRVRRLGSSERWRLVFSRLSERPSSHPALLWWEASEGTYY